MNLPSYVNYVTAYKDILSVITINLFSGSF